MEKEGCIRAMSHLKEKGLNIRLFVSDRHSQITKWMREEVPETKHKFDVWHIAKGSYSYTNNANNHYSI